MEWIALAGMLVAGAWRLAVDRPAKWKSAFYVGMFTFLVWFLSSLSAAFGLWLAKHRPDRIDALVSTFVWCAAGSLAAYLVLWGIDWASADHPSEKGSAADRHDGDPPT